MHHRQHLTAGLTSERRSPEVFDCFDTAAPNVSQADLSDLSHSTFARFSINSCYNNIDTRFLRQNAPSPGSSLLYCRPLTADHRITCDGSSR